MASMAHMTLNPESEDWTPAQQDHSPATQRPRHQRLPYAGTLYGTWLSLRGRTDQATIEVLNASYEGLQLESPKPIPINRMVKLRGSDFEGCAWVRHCKRRGRRFLVGVNLVSGLWSQEVCN